MAQSESSDLSEFGTNPIPAGEQSGIPVSGREREATGGVEMGAIQYRQWARFGDRGYVAAGLSVTRLCAQVYALGWQNDTLIFEPQPQQVDDLYEFENSIAAEFLNEVDAFWESAARYAERGFKHRRGFLLYGPAGGGKTALVQQAIQRVIRQDGIVLLGDCSAHTLKMALTQLRLIEPERSVLCVFEDIDAIIRDYGEAGLLSLLDGEGQINHCLNLATTNYPERLDRRIVGRPRRFDRRFKIDSERGYPDAAIRRAYLQKKLDGSPYADQIENLVQASEGMSLAALADLVISITCLGLDAGKTVKDIRELVRGNPRGAGGEGEVGFGGRR